MLRNMALIMAPNKKERRYRARSQDLRQEACETVPGPCAPFRSAQVQVLLSHDTRASKAQAGGFLGSSRGRLRVDQVVLMAVKRPYSSLYISKWSQNDFPAPLLEAGNVYQFTQAGYRTASSPQRLSGAAAHQMFAARNTVGKVSPEPASCRR